ncbi:MAG: hypothetical protein ISS34_00855 [Candidatus Omnitrophica bacterium]|nr:hypothetical protein [Candidatus Omnitrophota bacterium]
MISKKRLLNGLHELVHVEEGAVTLYANFTKTLLRHAEDIDTEKRTVIEKILTQLYKDSTRHGKLVDDLIEKVARDARDEY